MQYNTADTKRFPVLIGSYSVILSCCVFHAAILYMEICLRFQLVGLRKLLFSTAESSNEQDFPVDKLQ